MTTSTDILREAARVVREELPKHFAEEFTISDVQAESLPGPYGEDYIHVNVILEDGHPELEAWKVVEFSGTMRPLLENAGVSPIPGISYSNRSEFPR